MIATERAASCAGVSPSRAPARHQTAPGLTRPRTSRDHTHTVNSPGREDHEVGPTSLFPGTLQVAVAPRDDTRSLFHRNRVHQERHDGAHNHADHIHRPQTPTLGGTTTCSP